MTSKEIIHAVIVTYFPDIEILIPLIKRIAMQVDYVIVCDNSSSDFDINNYLKDEITNGLNIKIVKLNDNYGIGKAQNVGMSWSFANGANFVLQLDQDSFPSEDLINNLFQYYCNAIKLGYDVGLVGSSYMNDKIHNKNPFYYEKKANDNITLSSFLISSGTLVPKSTYEKIGEMDSELFIDLIDFEYCWRALSHNLSVHLVKNAIIEHKVGMGSKYFFFGLIEILHRDPVREYYLTRNTLILARRNYVPKIWLAINVIRLIQRLIFNPIFLDNGYLRAKYMFKGIADGFKGRFGSY